MLNISTNVSNASIPNNSFSKTSPVTVDVCPDDMKMLEQQISDS